MKKTYSILNLGLNGHIISCEIDSSKSLPGIEIIGLPDNAVKESKERIRNCFKNCGIDIPNKKFVINLSPSDLKKTGTRFDLAMAVCLLAYIKDIGQEKLEDIIFLGELGLDGAIKPIVGALPGVIAAQNFGYKKFFVPSKNIQELSYVKNVEVFGISHFSQLIDFFLNGKIISPTQLQKIVFGQNNFDIDFEDIKGHEFAKRALAIAASGMHNILMAGSPGSGKTLLARALKGILPSLEYDEILQVSQIYSLAGKLNSQHPLITTRPFRTIHHTASKVSIIGGTGQLLPGEISLAHKGILFLDEMTEFPKDTLDVLRQPIEDKKVSISRASGSVEYPSDFMLVGAMNPCKCGFYKDPIKNCSCSYNDIKKYQSKISGPMIDRFDMILEIPRQDIDTIIGQQKTLSTSQILEKIDIAHKIQNQRYKNENFSLNNGLTSKNIQKYIILEPQVENFFKQIVKSMNLSPRVIHRLLKLTRSVADYENSEKITTQHLAESLQYRSKHFLLNND